MSATRPNVMAWGLAAAASLGCVAVMWMLADAPDAEPAAARTAARSASERGDTRSTSRAPVWADGACGLAAGQRFGSTFFSEASLSLVAPVAATRGGTQDQTQTVSGELAFEVLDATEADAVVLVEFAREDQPGTSDKGLAADDLSAPFLARINERCEVAEFARHRDTSRTVARAQQSILHELWFSVPADGDKSNVTFNNAVGEALAQMQVGEDGDLTRTIHLYPETWSPDMKGVRVSGFSLRIERGRTPWFDSVHGDEAMVVPASQMSGLSKLRVDATDVAPDALANAPRDVAAYVWESMFKPYSDVATIGLPVGHAKRVEQMKDLTLTQALEKFGTLVATQANQEEQHFIMAAFLDGHPEHIKEYSQALATHFPEEWKPAGYAALQVTQHAKAKEALLDLFREDRLRPMERVRSSLALAGRGDVGAPLARELSAAANTVEATKRHISVPEHALMHLGVLAGTRADDEEVAEIVHETLSAKLNSAETPAQLKSVALAVANTGNVVFLPAMYEWTLHPDQYLRAEVARGIRRMPVAATREFTLEWLTRETSYVVKREIFEVMQQQYHDQNAVMDDELVAQAVAHLDQRPRALTRQSIYRLLTPVVRTHADVRRSLRELLVLEVKTKTGMAHYLMSVLPEADVNAALASIDELSDQFEEGATAPSASAPVEPESVEPPPDLAGAFEDMAIPDEVEGGSLVTE